MSRILCKHGDVQEECERCNQSASLEFQPTDRQTPDSAYDDAWRDEPDDRD